MSGREMRIVTVGMVLFASMPLYAPVSADGREVSSRSEEFVYDTESCAFSISYPGVDPGPDGQQGLRRKFNNQFYFYLGNMLVHGDCYSDWGPEAGAARLEEFAIARRAQCQQAKCRSLTCPFGSGYIIHYSPHLEWYRRDSHYMGENTRIYLISRDGAHQLIVYAGRRYGDHPTPEGFEHQEEFGGRTQEVAEKLAPRIEFRGQKCRFDASGHMK